MKINGYKLDPGADLRGANLEGLDLKNVDLCGANLEGAHLKGANLYVANLKGANLYGADLEGAKLYEANLWRAKLYEANLRGSSLTGADLRGADLRGADLEGANLKGAYLYRSDLEGANLVGANLVGIIRLNTSSVIGLLSPSKWMEDNFESNSDGYVVYKFFGESIYPSPSRWVIEKGSVIEEVPNLFPSETCGSGVNFATLEWINEVLGNQEGTIWKCLLKWKDGFSVCVPYGTDGKARCERLTLLEPID